MLLEQVAVAHAKSVPRGHCIWRSDAMSASVALAHTDGMTVRLRWRSIRVELIVRAGVVFLLGGGRQRAGDYRRPWGSSEPALVQVSPILNEAIVRLRGPRIVHQQSDVCGRLDEAPPVPAVGRRLV